MKRLFFCVAMLICACSIFSIILWDGQAGKQDHFIRNIPRFYDKNSYVFGVDISPFAIKVANINKERFNLSNVSFYKGDLFDALKDHNLERAFHIIVSNPPYISSDEIENLDVTVKDFEPRLALDGGLDGLDFYRRITSGSKEYLRDGGLLIYEIGYDQGEKVKKIISLEGFKDVSILKDLQGHDRVVLGFM